MSPAFPPSLTAGPNRLRRWPVMFVIAVALAMAVVFFTFDPATSGRFPSCLFRRITGLYCPGCGAQRAIHQLLHGHLLAAFTLNPLLVLCLPLVIYELARPWLAGRIARALPSPMSRPAAISALALVVIVYGVCRNLHAWPFTLLAPGALLDF